MKIVLIGATGYIGSEFFRQLTNYGLDFLSIPHSKVEELKDFNSWDRVYIINAAGYTGKPNVDSCEIYKKETIEGNVLLPQFLANLCVEKRWTLAHVSSGCIYTGNSEDKFGFTEKDAPNFTFDQNNCSFYSGTKAMAETIVSQVPRHYIWRLRIPFENNHNPRNYLLGPAQA